MCCETEYASKKMIRIEGALLKPLISSCGLENVTCGK